MKAVNSLQDWALFLKEDENCLLLQNMIEKAKDRLFEYVESLNQTGEYPLLTDKEIKELFGYLLTEPMMWEGERERAFILLGT